MKKGLRNRTDAVAVYSSTQCRNLKNRLESLKFKTRRNVDVRRRHACMSSRRESRVEIVVRRRRIGRGFR
ncbi:hypothetical protein DM56_4520 [Burkholderia mallei]|nr:hypothetical protein DM75_3492 [Burkholderia mallei]KOS92563.1 hypothetical protein DM45_3056 [Burkholderia mallei]KOS97093.1 hypothetical protein DM49_3285 [Burkholderia mallei]KOT01657.1 hypothetical protein DM50_3251 [Burkholderia mallei]KOT08278.1 hypothetical protein DM56_4520 [Burkholderia mallei]